MSTPVSPRYGYLSALLVEQEPQWGLIPRAGRFIFEEIAAQRSRDPDGVAAFTEYRVSCSYLELYNEKLFDLLSRGHGEEAQSANASV